MKLTERQLQMLRHAGLVDLSHKARKKSAALLNDSSDVQNSHRSISRQSKAGSQPSNRPAFRMSNTEAQGFSSK